MNGRIFVVLGALGAVSAAQAAPQDYRFEPIGTPTASGGKSVLRLRLVHLPDATPVRGAIVFEAKADMGPDGMATMTAPAKAAPDPEPGVWRVEVEPGMAGNWAVSVAAKVQGEAGTVRGSVTAKLGQ